MTCQQFIYHESILINLASSLGAALTLPISGFLIVAWGWESVFYVTGLIGVAWSALWFVLIYDSPAQHPRISMEERKFIEEAIGNTSHKGKEGKVFNQFKPVNGRLPKQVNSIIEIIKLCLLRM